MLFNIELLQKYNFLQKFNILEQKKAPKKGGFFL